LKLLGAIFIKNQFNEIVIPTIWEDETFIKKAGGSEILNQMFAFKDKGERDICLIPEVTGIIQQLVNENYFQNKYPQKLFYINKCYRYEKPQKGRYREFTQLGVEVVLKDKSKIPIYKKECVELLKNFLNEYGTQYTFNESVKRGLSYYIEEGFEVECENLGAQKQIAGGGSYPEGVGFAIGLERWLLALGKWQ
jgi:histidyl-tRNA synthetase